MLFLSKIIAFKTLKTGCFLRRLLQHNGRVQASYAICQGSSLSQVFFFNQVFLLLLQEKKGLWKIKIGAIYAFPEQNHIIDFKDHQNRQFSKKTPVAQWLSTVLLCILTGFKPCASQVFFQLGFCVAVTGNKWFVVNKNWRHLCIS